MDGDRLMSDWKAAVAKEAEADPKVQEAQKQLDQAQARLQRAKARASARARSSPLSWVRPL